MPKKQIFSSVSDLVRETAENVIFAGALERRLASRTIVKELMVLRATQGLSQKDIALKLGCTQGRISKLESLTDAHLRIGDLSNYADALGLELRITLESTERPVAARAKKRGATIRAAGERGRRKSAAT